MSYDLTASDDQERSDALECVAVGGVKLGVSEVEDGAWDGRGVQSSIVIKHRRIFDARCCAYEVRCAGHVLCFRERQNVHGFTHESRNWRRL